MSPLHLFLSRSPGVLWCAAPHGASGCYGAPSGADDPPWGLRPAESPSAPAHPGGTLLRSGRGIPAARAAPVLTQLSRSPDPVPRRFASPLESPAPAEGLAAGSQVCRHDSDLRNRAQTGLRGSPAGPLGSPTQH
ncbi:hypothetical protein NDU88_005466 [Pleurodeles waltl]|uniref:Secreted protein n=1 Tax=Pleurodeles waltl TaxID=8319 RepID=A0AAV7SLY5_PLEWA|nr:hypothetical protein NDU88_005466 [Pleurodeles waltl]